MSNGYADQTTLSTGTDATTNGRSLLASARETIVESRLTAVRPNRFQWSRAGGALQVLQPMTQQRRAECCLRCDSAVRVEHGHRPARCSICLGLAASTGSRLPLPAGEGVPPTGRVALAQLPRQRRGRLDVRTGTSDETVAALQQYGATVIAESAPAPGC